MKRLIYTFFALCACNIALSQTKTTYKDEYGNTIIKGTTEHNRSGSTTTYTDEYGNRIGTFETETDTEFKPIGSGGAHVADPLFGNDAMLKAIEIKNNNKTNNDRQSHDEEEKTRAIDEFAYSVAGSETLNEGLKLMVDKEFEEALKKLLLSEQFYSNTSHDLTGIYLNIAFCYFFIKDKENALSYINNIDHNGIDNPVQLWQMCLMAWRLYEFDTFDIHFDKLIEMAKYDKEALDLVNAIRDMVTEE